MAEMDFDLVVLGAGPGGYTAAIRAAQLGWKVACIDKEKASGGTCLRIGCIPSKALLESSEQFSKAGNELEKHGIKLGKVDLDLSAMMKRKSEIVSRLTKGVDGLLRKNKITRFTGSASIKSPGSVLVHSEDRLEELNTRHILIATGSVPATIPGVEFDGDRIGSSTEALAYEEVPKSLAVIGAGAIGLELGSVWKRLGSTVTVLEYMPQILPGMDEETAKTLRRILEKQGLEIVTEAKVQKVTVKKGKCLVETEGQKPLSVDRVLVAVGRRPNTEGLGLEKLGIHCNERGQITVDESFNTSVEGILAIGDVIPGAMLAHKAEEEGVACVEKLITGYGHIDYDTIPAIVYTHPEVASVGKTEEQLKQTHREYKVGKFPYAANGRAMCLGDTEGFVKILADAATDRILGAHVVGDRAGDLIAELAVAMEFSASSEDLARCTHAHPTLAEMVKEAAMAVDGRAINY